MQIEVSIVETVDPIFNRNLNWSVIKDSFARKYLKNYVKNGLLKKLKE